MLTPSTQYTDILPEDYMTTGSGFSRGDASRVMSRSELKRFGWCPSRWLKGAPDEESDSLEWGSLIDCLSLTPSQFQYRYIVTPSTYMAKGKKKDDPDVEKPWNRNATFCQEWEEEATASGKIALKPDKEKEARKAVARLLDTPKIARVLDGAKTQVPFVVDYNDPETGLVIPLKVLIDAVPTGSYSRYLVDLKTTGNAHPSMWAREVFKHWYDAQAALYLDAFNTCTGENRNTFLHIKQENFPPYETGTQPLSEDFILSGRARYLGVLAKYCRCLATDVWPDFDTPEIGQWCADEFGPVCEPEPFMVLTQL